MYGQSDSRLERGEIDSMRVAIVHDWLTVYGGAERVLEQIIEIFPDADIFTLFDFLPEDSRGFIQNKRIQTSFIQRLPLARKKYRLYLPFMPLAVEQFDLSKYDLVISSSHAVAKGVITGPEQIHVCYCHTPIRYAWDLQHQYFHETGLKSGVKGALARVILHYLRMWDVRTANGVDYFIANSHFVAKRIWKTYRRDSVVVYPPVDVDKFALSTTKEEFYLTVSRMVPYKKIDLIVEAFSYMPDKHLVVIGDGPDFKKVRAKAGPNVTLMGYQPFPVLLEYMQRARAFVFAAEEDFGIVLVEAQACGTPVIAYGKGGAAETVIPGETGVLFDEQSVSALVAAVRVFESHANRFDPVLIRKNAERFGIPRFKKEFKAAIDYALSGGVAKSP